MYDDEWKKENRGLDVECNIRCLRLLSLCNPALPPSLHAQPSLCASDFPLFRLPPEFGKVRTLRYVQSNHQQNEKCNLFCTNCCFLKVILTSAGFLLRSICSAQTCAWMKRYWKRMMLLSSLKVVERHLSHSFILTGCFV